MSNAAWYYSQGDAEKGPVNRKQLDAMARAGQLKADDLVWHEGMEDWQTAAAAGIVTPSGPKAAASTPTQSATPTPRPSGAPSTQPAPTTNPSATTSTGVGNWDSATLMRQVGLFVGQPLILFGLMFVLTGRGCDTLGVRWAESKSASASLMESSFKDEWEAKRIRVQQQIDRIRDKEDPDEDDNERREKLQEELQEIREDRDDEERTLSQTTWRSYKIAARDARNNHRLYSPYYHMMFLMGTFMLSVGLFTAGFTSQGSERWISMVMLAIVLFSIFIVGTPWVNIPIPG